MFHFEFLETGFTVGEIAGLISGSIATLHIAIPLAFAVVTVGLIKNHSHDAATWSVISHQLQSTLWPLLLQTDSAVGNWFIWKGKKIPWTIFFQGFALLLATLSLIAAGYLTPRPLVETKRPSHSITQASFKYVQDTSFYGQGTLPRPADAVWRTCGSVKFEDCPQSIYDDPKVRGQYLSRPNSTIVINSTIPDSIVDVFTSGTKNTAIANPLELQYRNWQRWSDWYVDNNEVKAQAAFHPLQTFVLADQVQLVEGLVVDAINGGICFRNHTIPTGLLLGAQWSEDLLCFEPETACTNTNLTLGFAISTQNFWTSVNGYMRDDGGFSNISSSPPEPAWDVGGDDGWRDTGPVPNLQDRADKAAWWNNQFTAQVLNVTSPQFGHVYRSNFSGYVMTSAPSSVKIDQMNGDYLDAVDFYRNSQASRDFSAYGARCAGYDDGDNATTSKAHIKCGYLYSVPEPTDADNLQMNRFDLNSNWTQQLYTCASAVKASVKTVTFHTTGAETLPDLSVISIEPKNYTAENMPYWAIEKADPQKYAVEDIQLFWGLVSASYAQASNPDITLRRAPSIYLPASSHGTTLGHMWNGFAGGSAFAAAWESVYEDAAVVKGTEENFMPSYSGDMDWGMNLKWRQLSKTPEGSAKILNLIWTDLIAFSVVGTRTGFEDGSLATSGLRRRAADDAADVLGTRPVHRNVRVIEYDDMRYAIPALVAGAIFLFGLLGALVMGCGCIVTRRTMIHYLNQVAMGRAVSQVKDDGVDSAWTTEEWVERAGKMSIEVPVAQAKVPKKLRTKPVKAVGGVAGEQGFERGQMRRRLGGNDYGAVPPVLSPYQPQGRWRREDFESP